MTGALYITDTQIQPDERGNVKHPGADRLFCIGPDASRQWRSAATG